MANDSMSQEGVGSMLGSAGAWPRRTAAAVAPVAVSVVLTVLAPWEPAVALATPRPARAAAVVLATPRAARAAAAPRPARLLEPAACAGGAPTPSLAAVASAVSDSLKQGSIAAQGLGAAAAAAGDGAGAAGVNSVAGPLGTASDAFGMLFAWAAFSQATAAFAYVRHDPLDRDDTTLFVPRFVHLPLVGAPTPRLKAAFASLNGFFDTVARFDELVVALRVSLDRAEAARVTGNEPWFGRQADATATFALEAARLLGSFPALQHAVARSFALDGLSRTLSARQVARAQAALARRVPPELTHLLDLGASALRPSGNGEVRALASLITDGPSFLHQAVETTPTALSLPAALDPGSLAAAEQDFAGALRNYAATMQRYGGRAPTSGAAAGRTRSGARSQLRLAPASCAGGPESSSSYGDPHEVTFAGDDYDFQAAGEFTLARSSFDNLDIEVRQQPFPGSGSIAVDTAVAMQVGFADVELATGGPDQLQLFVDRRPARLADRALLGGGSLVVEGSGEVTVRWPDGSEATVATTLTRALSARTACNTGRSLWVTLAVPRLQFGHLAGLLGQAGPVAGSSLRGGNGVAYPIGELEDPSASAHDFDVVYRQFGPSWRVSQVESLFAYPRGLTTASYAKAGFPSEALTIQSFTPHKASLAARDCRVAGIDDPALLADCVFDVGATGGSCFAAAAVAVQSAGGAPAASALPPSSGVVPLSTTTGTGTGTAPGASSTTLPGATAPGRPTSGAGPVVHIGTGNDASEPAVAVDSSGTAYVAWSLENGTTLEVCALARASSTCRPVALQIADPVDDRFFDPPSVLLDNGHVDVFEHVDTTYDGDLDGLDEYVSTDGGRSFVLTPHAVGSVPDGDGTAGHVEALPGGELGATYVIPGGNPEFQANSLASPADDSSATSPAYATLDPSPPNAYHIDNVGGVLGAQLTGSAGVLAVFEALSGTNSSPCPSSAPGALVYAYAPVSASTTLAALNTSPGTAGSAWRPLQKLDCEGTDPAVGGGPSGLGVLETVPSSSGTAVEYRHFSPTSGFGAPVEVAAGEKGADATLSEDGAGALYATWLDDDTGVDFSYSANGTSWSAPVTLSSASGNPSAISALAGAVDPSGTGWVAYTANGKEYAEEF
ncbi:MAG TPA: hypothetical protein VMD59_19340, partial [Acidimicrobiales bacterium]|nr:hypothetical protein [Acidimicrobiales bacterium]